METAADCETVVATNMKSEEIIRIDDDDSDAIEDVPRKEINAVEELDFLKHEFDIRTTILSRTWTELSSVLVKYRQSLIRQRRKTSGPNDEAIQSANASLKEKNQQIELMQRKLFDLEMKLSSNTDEIVILRTDVQKLRGDVVMKDKLIQTLQSHLCAVEENTFRNSLGFPIGVGNVLPPSERLMPIQPKRVMPKHTATEPLMVSPVAISNLPIEQRNDIEKRLDNVDNPYVVQAGDNEEISDRELEYYHVEIDSDLDSDDAEDVVLSASTRQINSITDSQTRVRDMQRYQSQFGSSFIEQDGSSSRQTAMPVLVPGSAKSINDDANDISDESSNDIKPSIPNLLDSDDIGLNTFCNPEDSTDSQNESMLDAVSLSSRVLYPGLRQNLLLNITSPMRKPYTFQSKEGSTLKYTCKLCGKRMLNSSNLKAHVRVHYGIKPFRCRLCCFSAAQKNNVLLHIHKKHRIVTNAKDQILYESNIDVDEKLYDASCSVDD